MSVKRLRNIPGFSIDQVAAAAGTDPDVLRLENLDTDLPPPPGVIESTRAALAEDDANSYLPFIGKEELRVLVAERLTRQTNKPYNLRNVVISCGATTGMLDVLLATTDPGDEVILTDPTYAGMINRVRLAGAIPRLAPFHFTDGDWRLDLEALEVLISERTRVLFIMNPSMPSGAVLNMSEWETIANLCRRHRLWLLYNAAMEHILFDNRQLIHPATFFGMEERTITIGSVSKEYRMIGWRIGWVVAPRSIVDDIGRVHIYNAIVPPGSAQAGALTALRSPTADREYCVREWEDRRDLVLRQLEDYKIFPAAGGWSLLLDVSALGLNGRQASRLLLEKGKIAATPMTHWGERHSEQYIRLVFSNEPIERLRTLGERFRKALG